MKKWLNEGASWWSGVVFYGFWVLLTLVGIIYVIYKMYPPSCCAGH